MRNLSKITTARVPAKAGERWETFSHDGADYRCCIDGDLLLHVTVKNKQGMTLDIDPQQADLAILKKGLKFTPRVSAFAASSKRTSKGARTAKTAMG